MRDITVESIHLLFKEDVDEEKLIITATQIPLPQRLSWLHILANIQSNAILEDYYDALHNPLSKIEGNTEKSFDNIYFRTKKMLHRYGCVVDRIGLAEDITEITQHIAKNITWTDINFDQDHPHYIRSEYLSTYVNSLTSVSSVCQTLNIHCIHCTSDSAIININGYDVDIILDEDNYADLRLEGARRSASIAINAIDLNNLNAQEVLELTHEIGHCRNHLTSNHPCGDFGLPFWDSELPAFEEEWRLCNTLAPQLDLRAWSLEAIKQSVFALFPLLAPELGTYQAFRYALEKNPLYFTSKKTSEWLLEKSPLFIWSGVPYVQYFLSLTHLLLRHDSADNVLASLLTRSYQRFTLLERTDGVA